MSRTPFTEGGHELARRLQVSKYNSWYLPTYTICHNGNILKCKVLTLGHLV